jgi:hypothetical protein
MGWKGSEAKVRIRLVKPTGEILMVGEGTGRARNTLSSPENIARTAERILKQAVPLGRVTSIGSLASAIPPGLISRTTAGKSRSSGPTTSGPSSSTRGRELHPAASHGFLRLGVSRRSSRSSERPVGTPSEGREGVGMLQAWSS